MLLIGLSLAALALAPEPTIRFQRTLIDSRFVSEGVAVGDVNRDGKLDVLAGNVWFEAPKWTPHEIAPVAKLDPKTQYSNCFHTWAEDLNRDGWPDQIVIGMPGEKAIWRENPKGVDRPWKEHLIWRSAGNESPLYEDLFGDGKRVLVMAYDDAHLAWFEPGPDPYAEWIAHDISGFKGSGSQRYSHGLGIGDLDGDGRNEVLTTGGYYRGSERRGKGTWTFVETVLGPDCAQMLVFNQSKGPRSDILTTSAHARGVWWFRASLDGGFERKTVDETIAGTHAAALARFGRNHDLHLVTGKRKWAHPPGVDVGSDEPSWLALYPVLGGPQSRLVIDEDSGVGTQFVVTDVNRDGWSDIVVANKNGVFLFEQKPYP